MNSKLTLERCRDPDSINHWFSSRRLIQNKWDFTVNGPTGYKERVSLQGRCQCQWLLYNGEYVYVVVDEVQINRVAIKKGFCCCTSGCWRAVSVFKCSFAYVEGIANRSSSWIDPWTTSSHTLTHILLLRPKEISVLGGIFTGSFVHRQNCKPGFCLPIEMVRL